MGSTSFALCEKSVHHTMKKGEAGGIVVGEATLGHFDCFPVIVLVSVVGAHFDKSIPGGQTS